jgi:hypothetical protein
MCQEEQKKPYSRDSGDALGYLAKSDRQSAAGAGRRCRGTRSRRRAVRHMEYAQGKARRNILFTLVGSGADLVVHASQTVHFLI